MTHKEIVMKLIGPIRPLAESNEDERRFENLKVMCELVDDLLSEISSVGYDFKDRYESSVKKASDYAREFINQILE